MSLMQHLEELRRRVIVVAVAVFAGATGGWFYAPTVLGFLLRPAELAGAKLIYLHPMELFWVYMKISVLFGLVVSSPIILYEVGAFLWPGLDKAERRYFIMFTPVIIVLFVLGIVFAYTVMLASFFRFFLGLSAPGVTASLSVGNYVSFVLNLILPLGFGFQLPVVLTLLTLLDILSPEFMRFYRKYAILGIVILAAILTPPDPLSLIVMAVPLLALYEVSLLIVRVIYRRRLAVRAAQEAALEAGEASD